ncbi:MAG TPA: hypothetical protein VNK52_00295 [Hyphomicrobiaceae bacterium]|nr:hypothetical protein [Hyphomicrobiaceae bacterium]
MNRNASLIALFGVLLSFASVPASAGGEGYRTGKKDYVCRDWRCRGSWQRHVRYSPAQYFDAFYYRSPGGISRVYSTTAYSADGHPRRYGR